MATVTKTTKRRKRGKRGMGRLYKRLSGGKEYSADSPVNAPYWLAYTLPNPAGGPGKRVRQPLHDRNGKPITDKKSAEAERKRILAPYQTGDAVETLRAIKARIDDAESEHATAIEQANPPLELTNTWEAYLASPERPDTGPATLRRYEAHLNRFLQWLANCHPEASSLKDVTHALAREYASDLTATGYSANTFNKHVGFLRLLCRVLAEDARLADNPFSRIKRKSLTTHSRRELTVSELTTVLDTAEGELALLLYVGACTGLRLGDCATLDWGEVDLARGVIRCVPNKTARKGKSVIVGIPPALHERLAGVPRRSRRGFVIPGMAKDYRRDPATVTNAVKRHFLDCGMDVHSEGTGHRIKRKPNGEPERDEKTGRVVLTDTGHPAVVDVGFHSLRHTYVSLHAERGTPQAVIQANVGHGNPMMTAHYTHIGEEAVAEAARALPVFSGQTRANASRSPIPDWAREALETMTANNWQNVRDELLSET